MECLGTCFERARDIFRWMCTRKRRYDDHACNSLPTAGIAAGSNVLLQEVTHQCSVLFAVLRNAGGSDTLCPTQESKLAVLWTIGIFALNFGPVFVGPVLDWVGPKLTTVLGKTG